MGSRFVIHLRRQWMGALALFLVLTGGVAFAANTVFSSDIVNNQVRSVDLRDDTLAGGGLAASDLRSGSVGTSEVLDDTAAGGGLSALDLRSGSVGPAEAAGLGPADIANAASGSDDVNADKLDGLDSSGLVQGRGTLLSNRFVLVPPDTFRNLLVIPGLGELSAFCSDGFAAVDWHNTTSSTVDRWRERNGSWTAALVPPTGETRDIAHSDDNPGGTLSLGLGDFGVRRIATVHAFAFQEADGFPCGFQAQGTVWASE